jgi:hypothetical protein
VTLRDIAPFPLQREALEFDQDHSGGTTTRA